MSGSLHKATINIQGTKNDNGQWDLNVSMNDTYDFKYGVNDYTKNFEAQGGANMAKYSQDLGVISTYGIKIKFNDKRK